MLLSNVFSFAKVFRGSIAFWTAPSGSLALRWELNKGILYDYILIDKIRKSSG